jgi:hypothetical protein
MSSADRNAYAKLVRAMRDAQKAYFQTADKARKTRKPEDYQASKEWLTRSKELEKEIDLLTQKILENEEIL